LKIKKTVTVRQLFGLVSFILASTGFSDKIGV